MNIPPLGSALPVQIIDNSLPGHSITQVTTLINDVSALQIYLQASLPTFTEMFYYPEESILQIQTSGDTADVSAIQSLIQAYPNPLPCITSAQNMGIAPMSSSSRTWKTVFVVTSPTYSDKTLIQAIVSAALTPASPSILQLSEFQYSVRIVAVETNQVLGILSAGNTRFENQTITLTNVPTQPFSLELQIQTSGGAFATLRNISLTYQMI